MPTDYLNVFKKLWNYGRGGTHCSREGCKCDTEDEIISSSISKFCAVNYCRSILAETKETLMILFLAFKLQLVS